MTTPTSPADIRIDATADPKSDRHIVLAAVGEATLHRDVLDLNSDYSRKRFVAAVLKALPDLNGSAEAFGRDIAERLLRLAAVPPGGPQAPAAPEPPADARAEPLAAMPPDVRAEAEQLLDAPDLLDRIVADIEALGVAGESVLVALLYLVAVSAQLRKPLAAIVRGSTASGKSYTVNRTFSLIPPEVALNATSLTTNALFYFAPGTLRHRVIVAGERSRVEDDNTAEATRALREMIEAGRLTKAVPIKEGDRIETQILEQEGPVAFVETTTLGQIFEEDANRCLLLATDEHEEQTRRVLRATAAAAAGEERPEHERRRQVHFALHRMLPRANVVIPFAQQIAERYPPDRVDARRSFRHLLSLTRAVALLHFRQRERSPDGSIVASIEDYAVAAELAKGPLGTATSGVTPGAREYLSVLKKTFGGSEFTTSEAQKVGTGSRRTRYGRLSELQVVGSVEQTEAARGKVPARWRLTGLEPGDGSGTIPRPEEVQEAHSGCTHAHKP